MTLVGTKVVEGSAAINGTIPTATDALFLAIKAERGRTDIAQPASNMAQYKAKYGDRYASSLGYDYLDYDFRQGLQRAFLIRYVGPAAVKATVTITDAAAAIVFTATAIAEGVWYNGLNIDITVGTGTERAIRITHDTDLTVNEYSGFYNSNAELLTWADSSEFIRLAVGASSLQPNAQSKNMGATVAGADDLAGIVDATRAAALTKFSKDLGPGQVAFADATTTVAHGQLLDHGALTRRIALPDPPDNSSKSSVLALTSALHSHVNASWGAMFYPWIDMDGLTPSSYRPIPPSAVYAALTAHNDANGVSIAQTAGGIYGIADQARKLRTIFPLDQDREDLNEGGVNLLHSIGGVIKVFGVRSLVNPLTNPTWKQITSRRTYMAIAARADAIMQDYVLRQIDGQGLIFKQLGAQLTTMLGEFYADGALHGATIADAFSVNVDSVNTPTTISNGEINAQLEIVVSPTGEAVTLTIIKNQIRR